MTEKDWSHHAEDERLMSAIAGGDRVAFATLVRRHLGRAVAIATRQLGQPAEAEDVAQEAFTKVWTHAALYRQPGAEGGAKFTTWFYRIIVNLAIDRQRKRKLATARLDDAPDPVDPAPGAFARLHGDRLSGRVAAAIAQLPERQRQALVLCFYEGFSNAEAAEMLDISVKALESLLVRARRTLRDDLEPVWRDHVAPLKEAEG